MSSNPTLAKIRRRLARLGWRTLTMWECQTTTLAATSSSSASSAF